MYFEDEEIKKEINKLKLKKNEIEKQIEILEEKQYEQKINMLLEDGYCCIQLDFLKKKKYVSFKSYYRCLIHNCNHDVQMNK